MSFEDQDKYKTREIEIFPLGVKSGSLGIPGTGPGNPLLGTFLCAAPAPIGKDEPGSNQNVELNFTGPPGSASGIYFSLVPYLEKNGFKVIKVDEWISVTPEHQTYYNMVTEQKRQLEGVIKTGLASAAQAVADSSLMEHDLRKYKEIMDYYKEGVGKGEKKGNEHSLRAMFIDQIDVHTGDGISLRSVVQRWPTIIADFMKLSSDEDSIEKVKKALEGISKAEAVILTTKNKLFIEWKKMFKDAAIDRYDQLKALADSRKKTVEEYRNWLKPYIARFKAMKLGHESIAGILASAKTPYELVGQASFMNKISLWAWKAYMPSEFRKPSTESNYTVPIADDFVVNNFIKDKKVGLANAKYYPQLNEETVHKDEKTGAEIKSTVADDMIEEVLGEWKKDSGLEKDLLYYVFFEIDVERLGSKIPGYEMEDITFTVKAYMLSQNVMLVKMLELKLREKEIEKYINQILGLQESGRSAVREDYKEIFEEPKNDSGIKLGFGFGKRMEGAGEFFRQVDAFFSAIGKGAGKLFSGLNLPLMFAKRGSYVRDFQDTIVEYFLKPMGTDYFGPVKGFIMDQMGVG